MPIDPTEFPDSERHQLCVDCRQWCEPEEGDDHALPRVSPFAGVADAAGVGRPAHFLCFACQRKRRRLRIGVGIAAVIVIGLVVAVRLSADM